MSFVLIKMKEGEGKKKSNMIIGKHALNLFYRTAMPMAMPEAQIYCGCFLNIRFIP